MNLSKISREHGVNPQTVYNRLKYQNKNLKDALYKGKYNTCFFLKDGRIIHQLLDKKQYSMFVKRIEKGMSSEEAYKDVLKCSGRTQKWNGTKHWIDGIPLSEYCRKNNLPYQEILYKLKTKSIKEAIDDYK